MDRIWTGHQFPTNSDLARCRKYISVEVHDIGILEVDRAGQMATVEKVDNAKFCTVENVLVKTYGLFILRVQYVRNVLQKLTNKLNHSLISQFEAGDRYIYAFTTNGAGYQLCRVLPRKVNGAGINGLEHRTVVRTSNVNNNGLHDGGNLLAISCDGNLVAFLANLTNGRLLNLLTIGSCKGKGPLVANRLANLVANVEGSLILGIL